jgi:hypothetical protein
MRTEIPLLQNVRVASPCSADWDEMRAVDGDRVRFCAGCRKRVYNLSALGQAEAEGLLRAHEGHLCVRYFRRADGTILTTDCPVGLRAARQLVLTRTRVSLGLCALLCVALAAGHAIDAATETKPAPDVLVPTGPLVGSLTMPPTARPAVTPPPQRHTEIGGRVTLGEPRWTTGMRRPN